MDEREIKFLDAAKRVIMRYGMKRTTMNDIAAEAGVSRQTLYSVFANKDEILRATLRYQADAALAAIAEGCAKAKTLGEKLDIFFEWHSITPYKQLHAAPDAEDLIVGFNEAGKSQIEANSVRFRKALTHELEPYEKQIKAAGLDLTTFADFICSSAAAYKHDAKSRQHLISLLTSLKAVILGTLRVD